MLCARSFKNHSDVAPKITHFSLSHTFPFTQDLLLRGPPRVLSYLSQTQVLSRRPASPSGPLTRALVSLSNGYSFTQVLLAKGPHAHAHLFPLAHAFPFTQAPLQNVLRSPTRSSHPLQGSPFQQVSNPFQHPFRCFPKRPSQTSQSPLRIPLIRCATTIPAVKRSFFVCGSRDAGQIARGVPGGV